MEEHAMSDRPTTPRPDDSRPSKGGFPTKLIIPGLLTVIAIVFIAQNRDKVQISLIFATVTMSLWLTLTIIFVVGLLVGLLVARRSKRKAASS
jgi:uncharacterized integral membrane protein